MQVEGTESEEDLLAFEERLRSEGEYSCGVGYSTSFKEIVDESGK